jgi:drug/metabolite transporter (DMT)-like permease
VNLRRTLVLAGMVVFSSIGDVCLAHGMKAIGSITLAHWAQLIPAVFNPWVTLGIVFLLGFFATYATALSWADLTYVLPATSLSYVLIALLSQWLLHENVTPGRWLGILLVTAGVGLVARGPSYTHHPHEEAKSEALPSLGAAGSSG